MSSKDGARIRLLGRGGVAEEIGRRPPNLKGNRSICSSLLTPLLREQVEKLWAESPGDSLY